MTMKTTKRALILMALLYLNVGTGCVSTKTEKASKAQDYQETQPGAAQPGAAQTNNSNGPAESTPAPSVIKADPIVSGIEWLSLEEAYARNQEEPRKIFVDVYTDWCGWCKKMDKVAFANDKVADYANEHYYAVKLDAESDREFEMAGQKMTEQAVARQLGVRSYPTIVLIHEDFQKFQPVPGYREAEDFLEILTKFKAININN